MENSSKLEYLYKEHKFAIQQVLKYEDRIDNIIMSSIVIIGSITAFISGKQSDNLITNISIAIPIAVIVVLSGYCISFYKLMKFGGYKKYIEQRITDIVEENGLCWENYVSEKNRRFDFLSISMYLVFIIILLILTSFSFFNVYKIEKVIFYLEFGFFILIFFIFTITLLKVGFMVYNDTYDYFYNINYNINNKKTNI